MIGKRRNRQGFTMLVTYGRHVQRSPKSLNKQAHQDPNEWRQSAPISDRVIGGMAPVKWAITRANRICIVTVSAELTRSVA